jgi:hypothetical protein
VYANQRFSLSGRLGRRGHGGNEIPTRNRKSEIGNPPPTAGAPDLYPNYRWAGGLSFEKIIEWGADSVPIEESYTAGCVRSRAARRPCVVKER